MPVVPIPSDRIVGDRVERGTAFDGVPFGAPAQHPASEIGDLAKSGFAQDHAYTPPHGLSRPVVSRRHTPYSSAATRSSRRLKTTAEVSQDPFGLILAPKGYEASREQISAVRESTLFSCDDIDVVAAPLHSRATLWLSSTFGSRSREGVRAPAWEAVCLAAPVSKSPDP